MRVFPLIACLLIFTCSTNAQSFEWVKSFQGIANDQEGFSITTDASGNVYTTGFFQGEADFDPGAGSANFIANGDRDVFVQKMDASGNFLWARTFGGITADEGKSIAVDAAGNVYLTGGFSGTVDFDPGAGTMNITAASSDAYILKLDTSGIFLWVKTLGGTGFDAGNSITTDASGNVYTAGFFSGTVDFDTGPATSNLTVTGQYDVFVHKMDASGNFLWAKSFGGTSFDFAYGIAVDLSGNVFTTGEFNGNVDFDPGAAIAGLNSAGSYDIFIQKLDPSGNYLWAKRFGSSSIESGKSICVDDAGNVHTTGNFTGTVDFDPGAGITNLTANGQGVFVNKLDAAGNFLWAKSFDGTGTIQGNSIQLDASGSLYTTGCYSATVDFDAGAGVTNLTATGVYEDVFVQKMDASGNFIWARFFGGTYYDMGRCVAVDPSGNLYVTGYFTQTVDFNAGAGVSNLTSAGGGDVFVLKMGPCAPVSGTDVITSCDSYTWIDGVTYTSSNNTATHTLVNETGCDSTVTLDLTISYSPSLTDTVSSCGAYTWINGVTYTSSNYSATHTLPNGAGCDSIITLNLTIDPITGTDVVAACDSYTWIDGNTYTESNNTATHNLTTPGGCDSIVTLNLTINNSTNGTDVITACNSYTWIDGNTYNSSNNAATYLLTNAAGCDSIVTLDLTINNFSSGTDVVTACDSYTWIDGNTYTLSNNNATHILTNAAGCDSVVTLNLTLNNSTSNTAIITACGSYDWIDGNTYTESSNTAIFTLFNSAGCDSIVSLNLTIIPSVPSVIENGFSIPSDPDSCTGSFIVNISGNPDFELITDGGVPIVSAGNSILNGLCPGIHDLQIVNFCGDTFSSQFVIPDDSSYIFNNPFVDSLAQDSLGVTLENCSIFYAGIDTAYIDSIWANGNTVNVIWNIVDSNGSNFDTTSYQLNNGNGVYWLQISIFCPTKSANDYFAAGQTIYFENGNASTAGIADQETTGVLIYPNPATAEVTILFNLSSAELMVYDTQGKLVKQGSIHTGEKISLQELEPGVYFFEVSMEQGKAVKRIVKQ